GEEAGRAAARLVRAGLAYVIASDGHPGSREHTLADGAAAAARSGASRTQILQLTEANPRFLLQHGLPCPAPRRAVAIARARDAARRLRPRELRSS
ncbi:MAG: hypothetical protein HZB46_11485, partial [Solirubrobacterales bacterium]|nr:hypothetical protein [Solirubrobacterales bacterium]